MTKKLLSIGEAAEVIGVSIDTLRQWEKKNILPSFRPSPTSKRYYRRDDIDNFLQKNTSAANDDLESLAKQWAFAKSSIQLPSSLYCQTSDVFGARLNRFESELGRTSEFKDIFSLFVAIIGEIGNNSFNHNIGNWPDVPGTFFGFDLARHIAVVADRGQGAYNTLKRVVPNLKDDEEALYVAFTKYISGRAPEDRGNGLKFVRDIVVANPLRLEFYTGNAELELTQGDTALKIKKTDASFHGCIAILHF